MPVHVVHRSTRRLHSLVAAFALAAALVSGGSQALDQGAAAPEIARPDLKWFNVAAPVTMESLRGRIVVLDFWTEGCINCIHIIPTLRAIEEKYPDRVAVIGVHSPKFAEEKRAESVQDAIQRYEIRHPIVHDPKMQLWNAYDVQAWPTLVIIGADGKVLANVSGEPDPQRFATAIGQLVARAEEAGTPKAVALDLKPEETPQGRFLFPGKLKRVPGETVRWALADAGHHQIVLLDDAGKDVRRYGSGKAGSADGDANTATFKRPQGLIASDDAIFVADTDNHAIRRIDLASGQVTTLAGDGRRGTALPESPQAAKTTSLASPWDLEKKGNRLFFANAGTHQIGALDLDAGRVSRYAGSGAEELTGGEPQRAAFAQPSGLALSPDGRLLYVADAESSAVRAIALDDGARTRTIVGAGLFDFGRKDGSLSAARFQHPLGVAAATKDTLIVADTYNSRIRTIDLARGEVSDFDGGKYTCTDPICYPLREPAGVVVASADRVLLVDTGNHRIEEFQPSTKTSRTWAR